MPICSLIADGQHNQSFLSGIRIVTRVNETWVDIFRGSATLPLKIEAGPVFKTHENEEHLVKSKAF